MANHLMLLYLAEPDIAVAEHQNPQRGTTAHSHLMKCDGYSFPR